MRERTTTDHRTATETATAPLAPALIIVHHPQTELLGEQAIIADGEELVLGRQSEAFGRGALDQSLISRRHATVVRHGNAIMLRDLKSRNGTSVNGQVIAGAHALQIGDVIGVGRVLLLYRHAPLIARQPRHPLLIGVSPELGEVLHRVRAVAERDLCVLIHGETGVGKELVARAIHDLGGRSGSFVAVNCGSLSDGVVHSELFGHAKGAFSGAGSARAGLVDSARGGTLFLDEIGDASPSLQASLLRLLEQHEFRRVGSDEVVASEARIVAATHASLSDEVARGRFRQDLFGRLEQWVINVPPLRERPEDVAVLAPHFARAAAGREVRLSRSLMIALLRTRWPQNVRQLRAVVAQAVVECEDGGELRLSDAIAKRLSSIHHTRDAETETAPQVRPQRPSASDLRDQLVALNCNISAVSEALGVSRNSLYRWIEEAGIDLETLRRGPPSAQ